MSGDVMGPFVHGEAFCHMRYASKDRAEWMTIWNSRDGVTPFGISHPRTGTELLHVDWRDDLCDPLFVPEVGAYVFIDLDPEKAMQLAMRKVEMFWDHQKYPMREMFESKQEAAKTLLDDYLWLTLLSGERVPKGEPDLVQVTEPLRDRLRADARERLQTVGTSDEPAPHIQPEPGGGA